MRIHRTPQQIARTCFSQLAQPLNGGNLTFYLLMFILGCTNIVFTPYGGSRFWAIIELISDVYLLCALLQLFHRKWHFAAQLFCAIIAYILAFIDMVCLVKMSTPITSMTLQLLIQSNQREIAEAICTYTDWHLLLSPLTLIIIQIPIGLCLISLNYKPKKKLSNKLCCFSKKVPLAYIILPLVFVSIPFSFLDKSSLIYLTICHNNNVQAPQYVLKYNQRTTYYLPFYRLIHAINEVNSLSNELDAFNKSLNRARVTSFTPTFPHIVLIIGESYNRHHSQLYGYPLSTTPYQVKRYKQGELVRFDNMISVWNLTFECFRRMFSTHCAGQTKSWSQYPPFPVFFRKVGYKVKFFSNQYVLEGQGFSDFIEDVFFNNPATSSKLFNVRNQRRYDYDLQLLNDYDKTINPADSFTLDIFHFLGLHADFKLRYPPEYTYFTPSKYHRPDLTPEKIKILADYDNAVRYNDAVINNILKRYEQQEAIVVFVPDHGERVFDNSTEWGRSLTWATNDIRQQFDIPFWIWASTSYRQRHVQLWNQIKQSSKRRGINSTIAQLLLHLANIQTPYYHKEFDIIHPNYNENRPRFIRNERNYDMIIKNSL